MNIVIKIWKIEASVFWNKSLNQLQIAIGKRFFAGSEQYKKAFFVIKSTKKDFIVFPRLSKNKTLEIKSK